MKPLNFQTDINNFLSDLIINPTRNLGLNEDLVIVAIKSTNINNNLISELVNCNKEILFLQNGVSLYLTINKLSQKFNFGTISGIQATLNGNNLTVRTNNCKIAINRRQINTSLSNLSESINPYCKFLIGDSINEIFLVKFARWLIVSIITSLTKQTLANALEIIPKSDMLDGIDEILKFINLRFEMEIKSETVSESIKLLPRNTSTSSFRDYLQGKKSEMILELEYLLKYSKNLGLDLKKLEFWLSELKVSY